MATWAKHRLYFLVVTHGGGDRIDFKVYCIYGTVMKEFEHFTVCHFCLVIMGEEPAFSFVVPRSEVSADVCAVCLGEIINNLSTIDTIYFIEQRRVWEKFGKQEEEQDEEERKLDEEEEDRDGYIP